MIVQVACDPRELERALHHSKGCVAVPIQDAVAQRAMIRADPHGDPAVLAKSDKRRETLANPAQLRSVLLVGVFTDDEFLRVRVVTRIDPHFIDPFRGFHGCFGFEMNVGNDRYIAASYPQTLHDIFEIACIFHRWRGDAYNFAAHVCQLHRLLDRQLGIHRVTGDHRLDADRICPANTDVADLHFTSKAAPINEWVRAVVHRLRLRVRAPLAISLSATIILTSIRFVLPSNSCTCTVP